MSSMHRYLGKAESAAIENWNKRVPSKNHESGRSLGAQDPAVQAYIEAKMALFKKNEPPR